MPNHEQSPNRLEYLGSSMGPLDELFENWLKQQEAAGNLNRNDEASLKWAQYVFFCACTEMYNTMMIVIKGDHTLKSFSIVSEAMRVNIDNYMTTLPKVQLN